MGDKKNATFNGLSLAGNTAGAIIVFHFISQLFDNLPYESSLQYLTGCTLGFSMIFTLIYLIPQRHISKHMENAESESKGIYLSMYVPKNGTLKNNWQTDGQSES